MHKFYRVIKIDHSLILIHLASNNKPRGPGFWKLNTSFLLDSYFIELIKKTIDELAIENRTNVLLWDTMKMQIRSSSLKYAREKKAEKRNKTNPHQFLGVAAAVVSFLNLSSKVVELRAWRVRGVPDNGIRLECFDGDNLIFINI